MSCLTIRPSANSSFATTSPRPRTGRGQLLTATTLVLLAGLSVHCPQPASAGVGNGSARSQNFIATAPTEQFAQQICIAAEQYRRDLALEWLGRELPPWQDPCPIRVMVGRTWAPAARPVSPLSTASRGNWDMEIPGQPRSGSWTACCPTRSRTRSWPRISAARCPAGPTKARPPVSSTPASGPSRTSC